MADTYADIRIRVRRWDQERGAYPVEASLDDSSQFPDGELRLDRERLLAELPDAQAYGLELFDTLISGRIRRAYDRATGRAEAETEGRLRVRLWIDDEAAELQAIPWERIYHTQRGQDIPLATSTLTPFSRYTSLELAEAKPVDERPIKLLFAIANPEGLPPDLSPIPVEDEVKALAAALGDLGHGSFRVTLLPGRTGISDDLRGRLDPQVYDIQDGVTGLDDILRHLPGHHVFHFLGHGAFRRQGVQGEGTATLYLEEGQGTLNPVPDSDLVPGLAALDPLPHLVFLAACDSAKRPADSENPYVGLAPKLVGRGVPAVVAMQDQIRLDQARQLTVDFYRRLLDHGVVDRALNEARNLLFRPGQTEWAIPVLFMRLADGLLFLPQELLAPAPRRPYKGLVPYSPDDADLFKGRSELADRVCEQVRDYPITVVYGEAGVGLTSLLEAGVRPKLEREGDVVIRVDEYEDLAGRVRARLRASLRSLRLREPAAAPLPDLLRAVVPDRTNRFVLVLDQFERAFDLPPEAQAGVVSALTASQEVLGARLRVVFVVHSDYLGRLATLQEKLAGLAQPWLAVPVLDSKAATAAIVEPLRELKWPVTLDPEFAQREIIRDLDRLYEPEEPAQPGELTIDPSYLQIVCCWLYEAARHRDPPIITEALYVDEAGGADGILARYVADTLHTHLADEPELAERILVQMASPEADLRVTAEGLHIEGVELDRVQIVLERLVNAALLVRRLSDDRPAYAFANQIVAQEARRLGGQALEDRYRAGDELERAWRMWWAVASDPRAEPAAANRTLPDLGQIRYLAESGTHLRPGPHKSLLLLRAALARGQIAMHPWLDWLRTPNCEELLRALETPERNRSGHEETHVALEQARRLLDLGSVAPGGRPREGGPAFGIITRCALQHPDDAVARRTAALALTALQPSPDEAFDRLDAGLKEERHPWQRWRRRSELWGTLFDADASFPTHSPALSWLDRLGIWSWRVWRRLVYDRQRFLGLTLGGAVGAGVGLGLLRGATARAAGLIPGLQFGTGIWWGLILGAGLVFGLLLPEAMLLPSEAAGQPAASSQRRIAGPLAVLLGALAFGFAHFLIFIQVGLQELSALILVNQAALLTGLGLSLGLYGWSRPQGETRTGWSRRLHRALWLLPVVAGAALGQIIIYLAGREWSTSVGVYGTVYRSELAGFGWSWWQDLIARYPHWYQALGLLDSVLVGVVLFVGVAIGGRLANRWLRRLQ